MSAQGIPRFSSREIKRRHRAAERLMEQADVDALLVFGHSGARRHYQADVYYLTEVAAFHESYLLFPRTGEPVLWVTHYNHLASAKEVSAIGDVRRAARRPVGLLTSELKKRGLAQATLGLVGTFYYQEIDGIRGELPGLRLRDLSTEFKLLRARKSEEELQFQRIAAGGCDAVMTAVAKEIRAGVEERDLLVLSEEVAWRSDCTPNFLYLNSTPMRASESCVPNQNISRRKLVMGDVINTELTVSYGFYSAQLLRPFFLGEPTPEYARLYDVLKAAHDELAAVIKPGATADDIHEASGSIERAGYTTVDSVAHGFGIDILPPNVRSKGFDAPPPFVIEKDMTIVIQPNPTTKDERIGMQLGEMGLVTGSAFVSMHSLPAEVIRCG